MSAIAFAFIISNVLMFQHIFRCHLPPSPTHQPSNKKKTKKTRTENSIKRKPRTHAYCLCSNLRAFLRHWIDLFIRSAQAPPSPHYSPPLLRFWSVKRARVHFCVCERAFILHIRPPHWPFAGKQTASNKREKRADPSTLPFHPAPTKGCRRFGASGFRTRTRTRHNKTVPVPRESIPG